MRTKIFILGICALPLFMQAQVIVQKGAELYLQENSEFTVQGDIEADESILGKGFVVLNGLSQQVIRSIELPGLLLDNHYGAVLNSPLKIGRSLMLRSGHLLLNQYDLELGSEAFASGDASAYINSNGSGRIIKYVESDLNGFTVPLGTGNSYAPLLLRSGGSYRRGKMVIGAKDNASPNKPLSSKDYLQNYWTIDRSGINGDVIATAFYNKVSGNEENMQPYYWNGNKWINKETPVDTRNKLLNIAVPEGSGEIYAMRKGDEPAPAKFSMVLLPNPVRNIATLLIRSNDDENATIRVTDNNGTSVIIQRVILRKGLNQVYINVMSLAGGQYIISSTGKGSQPIKMIKQ